MFKIFIIILIILICYVIFAVWHWRKNKTRFKDYFNPKKINHVLIWFCQLYLKKNGLTNTYLTREDIINYGFRFSKCYPCIIAGKCVDCNCDAEGKFNNPHETCSSNKFGIFQNKEQIDNYYLNPNSKFKINVTE
jgi:hypothetical protein